MRSWEETVSTTGEQSRELASTAPATGKTWYMAEGDGRKHNYVGDVKQPVIVMIT